MADAPCAPIAGHSRTNWPDYRVKRPGDPWKVIEQHLFCVLDEDRITALDLVCSGFRPDAAGEPSKSVK